MIGVIVLGEFCLYVALRWSVRLGELFYNYFISNTYHEELKLQHFPTYKEWRRASALIDKKEGRMEWKVRPDSRYYDHELIETLLYNLRTARKSNDVRKVAFQLRGVCHKNMGGIDNLELHVVLRSGTKSLVEKYVEEVRKCIMLVYECNLKEQDSTNIRDEESLETPPKPVLSKTPLPSSPGMKQKMELDAIGAARGLVRAATPARRTSIEYTRSEPDLTKSILLKQKRPKALSINEKIDLFRELKLSYGNTALCLSGGGGFGNFHWGVIRALLDLDYLPHIISGTSAGAVVAAFVCTRSISELKQRIVPELANILDCFDEPWGVILKRYWKEGYLYDLDNFEEKLKKIVGETTFAEAFQKTGRVLNISITSKVKNGGPPKILNYITTPNVFVYSAILASSALPRFTRPVILKAKDELGRVIPYHLTGIHWSDGSISSDIPIQTLSELFNVSYFIVSQVNPHIVPFFFNSRGAPGAPRRRSWRGVSWRGGFLLSFFESLLKRGMKMLKWGQILVDLDMFPVLFDLDFRQFFSQSFTGQITITPKTVLSDFAKIFSNPTPHLLAKWMRSSEIETWKRMSMIETRGKIAKALDECYYKLQLIHSSAGSQFNH